MIDFAKETEKLRASKGVVVVGDLKPQIQMDADLLNLRGELLARAATVKSVTTPQEYDAAAKLQNELNKTSNALDASRKLIAKPYADAAAKIKEMTDDFRAPMDAEKTRIKFMADKFLNEQKAREEAERKAAEAEQRRAVEAQLVAQESQRELFGDAAPEVAIVVPVAAPVLCAPRSSASRQAEVIEWQVTDIDKVPRGYLMLDERIVNGFKRGRGDVIKQQCKEGKGAEIIPGIIFSTKWESQGR